MSGFLCFIPSLIKSAAIWRLVGWNMWTLEDLPQLTRCSDFIAVLILLGSSMSAELNVITFSRDTCPSENINPDTHADKGLSSVKKLWFIALLILPPKSQIQFCDYYMI